MPKPSAINTHESFREEPVRASSDRTFGFVLAAFFGVVGLAPLWRHAPMREWALWTAGAFAAVAWLMPARLAPLNRAWTAAGRILNRITNPIVLGIMFYGVVTPFACVARFLGRDPLGLTRDPGAPTYWRDRTPPGPPPETMARQF